MKCAPSKVLLALLPSWRHAAHIRCMYVRRIACTWTRRRQTFCTCGPHATEENQGKPRSG